MRLPRPDAPLAGDRVSSARSSRLISVALPTPELPSAKTPAGLCRTERRAAVHQLSRALEQAPDGRRQIYFSNTFSICPTFFSTFPVFFSAVPSACKLGLFVTVPGVFLTLPFTS